MNLTSQVKEETDKVIINCLDINVKSASFSVGERSEYILINGILKPFQLWQCTINHHQNMMMMMTMKF